LEEFARKLDGDEFFFIVGIDVLSRFHEWRNPDRILELCRLVAVSRPGYSAFDWPTFYAVSPGAVGRVEMVSSAMVDVSGTELRQRAAAGLTLRGLVPEPVEEYIRQHGLYRGGPESQEEE
jgi:nicotinate-nucleotide adenylyltransferase